MIKYLIWFLVLFSTLTTIYSQNEASNFCIKPDEYIFIASRLEPENNADIAIRAMEMVNTNKYLVIAGGANYDSDYIKKIQDTNDKRIIFLGPVYKDGHIKELHCNCFAYFHGNEVGGTNPALLKAMGYGNKIFAINNRFNNFKLQKSPTCRLCGSNASLLRRNS